MKCVANISSILLLTIGIITFPLNVVEPAIAIGCDTYERIRAELGSCTGGTTEYSRELWLERYVVCLEQQLAREVTIYDRKIGASYAEWNQDSATGIDLDRVSLQEEAVPPLTVSQSQSAAYRRNKDLCNN
ncbi:MAG: hypothetical protein AAF298_10455 [Cyanobacteria bacterium P01_A01_bin.40]